MLKILNAEQNQKVDAYTIKNNPILSVNLMENAAKACTKWITKNFDTSHSFIVFAGPGNNGGDALAIARLLIQKNYHCKVYLWGNKFSPDNEANQKHLINLGNQIYPLKQLANLPNFENNDIIIDGIFGSGLKRPVAGFAAEIISHINFSLLPVISIDIPSGLFSEDNNILFSDDREMVEKVVFADYTLNIEMPFLSMLLADNQDYVGEWTALSIGLAHNAIKEQDSPYYLLDKKEIKSKLLVRDKFSHKGTFGHALLAVGSYGKFGAAVLASKAALRSGLGLLTAHVPRSAVSIMQTAVPEAMLSIDENKKYWQNCPNTEAFSAIGVGCGIGQKKDTANVLEALLLSHSKNLVLDADALNLIAKNKEMLKVLPKNTIITPHPKEFERLFGKSDNAYQRLLLQQKMAKKYHIIIILKGAYTAIADSNGNVYFNTTGNNGMATGGSGDVLTGFITGLLASGYEKIDAAIVGVYIHGLAADMALKTQSEETLIASDIINHFAQAFQHIKQI